MADASRTSSKRAALVEEGAIFKIDIFGAKYPHLVFAVTGRAAPDPSDEENFSLRPADGGVDDATRERREQLARSLDIPIENTVWFEPTPGGPVKWISEDDAAGAHEAGGLLTTSLNLFLCVPCNDNAVVLIFDTRWWAMGVVNIDPFEPSADVVVQAVKMFVEKVGSNPKDLVGVIAPSIGPCCHNFDDPSAGVSGGQTNLWDAARAALLGSGLLSDRVINPRACTACRDVDFFTQLIDGPDGGAGAVVAGIKDTGSLSRMLEARRTRAAERGEGPAAVAAPASAEEFDASLSESERRLNATMKCPYGRNKVYIRSVLDGGEPTDPEVALRCAVVAHVGLAAAGHNIVERDFIERICCGEYERCKAYREFLKRKRR